MIGADTPEYRLMHVFSIIVEQYGERPENPIQRLKEKDRKAEIKTGLSVLADEVTRALRRQGLKGEVITVQIRRPDMVVISRQKALGHFTYLQLEIQEVAMELVRQHWRIGAPIRALTVGVTKLVPAGEVVEQVSLFDFQNDSRDIRPRGNTSRAAREKQGKLEALVDELREKHGESSITLGYQENKEIGVIRGEGRR